MPAPLADVVKLSLKEIKGCDAVKIYRSTLIENERWKSAANPQLDQEGATAKPHPPRGKLPA